MNYNIYVCPYCGGEIRNRDSDICPHCGKKFDEAHQPVYDQVRSYRLRMAGTSWKWILIIAFIGISTLVLNVVGFIGSILLIGLYYVFTNSGNNKVKVYTCNACGGQFEGKQEYCPHCGRHISGYVDK